MPKSQTNNQLVLTYPLNLEMLTERIAAINTSIDKLKSLQTVPPEVFLKEKSDEQYIVRGVLHIALQALLDMANHVVTRIPEIELKAEPYRESVRQLNKAGVISSQFLPIAEKMASYRNRLVHFYLKITPEELYDILQNHLWDIDEFKRQLARFIDQHKSDTRFLMTTSPPKPL